MPTYDYECTVCGQVIEITHSIKDDAVEHQAHNAPQPISRMRCDGKLKRLISKSGGFRFKDGAPTPKHYE